MHAAEVSRAELVVMISAAAEGLPSSLSDPSEVEAYADKLQTAARFEVVRKGNVLLGLIAYYANDLSTRQAFITLVSVAPSARKCGIAGALLGAVIDRVRGEGFNSIALKVLIGNQAAKALYAKHKFRVMATDQVQHLMKRDI